MTFQQYLNANGLSQTMALLAKILQTGHPSTLKYPADLFSAGLSDLENWNKKAGHLQGMIDDYNDPDFGDLLQYKISKSSTRRFAVPKRKSTKVH